MFEKVFSSASSEKHASRKGHSFRIHQNRPGKYMEMMVLYHRNPMQYEGKTPCMAAVFTARVGLPGFETTWLYFSDFDRNMIKMHLKPLDGAGHFEPSAIAFAVSKACFDNRTMTKEAGE